MAASPSPKSLRPWSQTLPREAALAPLVLWLSACGLIIPPDDGPCNPELQGQRLSVRVLERWDENSTRIGPPENPREGTCGAMLAFAFGDVISFEVNGLGGKPSGGGCRNAKAEVFAASIQGQEAEMGPWPEYAREHDGAYFVLRLGGVGAAHELTLPPMCSGAIAFGLPQPETAHLLPVMERGFRSENPERCGLPEDFHHGCLDYYVVEFIDDPDGE